MEKTVAILGCGTLGTLVAEETVRLLPDHYDLVGAYNRTKSKADAVAAASPGCRSCATAEELFSLRADYVIEAAGGTALKEFACSVLRSGSDLIVLSVGALADDAFLNELTACAEETGRTPLRAPSPPGA